jgi:hypothetical protein
MPSRLLRYCLAVITLIGMPFFALGQPLSESRDYPSGDVWISDAQDPPLAATARQMQLPGDSVMPTGDVWPSPEGAIETAQQAPTGPQGATDHERR